MGSRSLAEQAPENTFLYVWGSSVPATFFKQKDNKVQRRAFAGMPFVCVGGNTR